MDSRIDRMRIDHWITGDRTQVSAGTVGICCEWNDMILPLDASAAVEPALERGKGIRNTLIRGWIDVGNGSCKYSVTQNQIFFSINTCFTFL